MNPRIPKEAREPLTPQKIEFSKITGLSPKAYINRPRDRVLRQSPIFNNLAEKIFDHPRLLVLLEKKVRVWLKKDHGRFMLSLAGYIYYFLEDYKTSTIFFVQSLQHAPRDLDSWLDLAFSLYHRDPKRQDFAKAIIFAHEDLATHFIARKISLRNIQAWLDTR